MNKREREVMEACHRVMSMANDYVVRLEGQDTLRAYGRGSVGTLRELRQHLRAGMKFSATALKANRKRATSSR